MQPMGHRRKPHQFKNHNHSRTIASSATHFSKAWLSCVNDELGTNEADTISHLAQAS